MEFLSTIGKRYCMMRYEDFIQILVHTIKGSFLVRIRDERRRRVVGKKSRRRNYYYSY